MGSSNQSEARLTAALAAALAESTEAAQRELDAFHAAVEAQSKALAASLAANYESLRSVTLAELIADFARLADDEARAAVESARLEARETFQQHLATERRTMQDRLEAVEASAQAQLQVEEAARATLSEALEVAQAEVERTRAAAQAHVDAMHANLRTQLQAGQDMNAALTEALAKAQAELERARDEARAAHEAAAQIKAESQARIEAVQAVAQAHAESVQAGNSWSTVCAAIDRAESLSDVLTAVLERLGREFSRAAVFLVKGNQLQEWRSLGFDGPAADAQRLELPVQLDSPLTRAVSTAHTVVTRNRPAGERPGDDATAPSVIVAIPIQLGNSVVAVAYGDDTPGESTGGASFTRAPDVAGAERMVSHATQRLRVLMDLRSVRPQEDNAAQVAAPASPTRKAGMRGVLARLVGATNGQ